MIAVELVLFSNDSPPLTIYCRDLKSAVDYVAGLRTRVCSILINAVEIEDDNMFYGGSFAGPYDRMEVATEFKVTPDQVMSNDKIKEVDNG